MKYLLTVLVLLHLSVGFSQNRDIKTNDFENDLYFFRYPKSWKIHNNHGELALSPKYYLRNGRNYFKNILTFYKFDSKRYNINSVEDAIQNIISLQSQWDGDTEFTMKQGLDANGEIHMIELRNDSAELPMRGVIYIYNFKGCIYGIRYNVETDKYDDYIKEARIIFDSFQFIN